MLAAGLGSLHVVLPATVRCFFIAPIHLFAVSGTTLGYLARWSQALGRLLSEAVWRFDIQRRAVTSVGWTSEASLVDFARYKYVGIGLVVGNTLLLCAVILLPTVRLWWLLFLSALFATSNK